MQCQLRTIARIRPLNKQEIEKQSRICVRPIFETINEDEVATVSHQSIKPSSHRRHRSSPLISNPYSENSTTPNNKRQQLNKKKGLPEGKKSDKVPKSLIAGTENIERFDFDTVFGPDATQKDFYMQSKIRNAIRLNTSQGINTTIIAIGSSASGKTYTMKGGSRCQPNDSGDDGILPRAVYDLFEAAQRLSSSGQVVVTMSFYEVLESGSRDLLANDKPIPAVQSLSITKKQVESPAQVKALLDSVATHTTEERCHQLCSFQTSCKASLQNDKITTAVDIVSTITFVNLAESTDGSSNMSYLGQSNCGGNSQQLLDTILGLYASVDIERMLPSVVGPCLTILVACVSPAEEKLESTLDILRLTQISNRTEIGTERHQSNVTTSQEEFDRIVEENKALKARIEQISSSREKMSSPNGKAQTNNNDEETLSESVNNISTTLQQKLRLVEEAAQKARESSQSFTAAADRWRSHRKQLVEAAKIVYTVDKTSTVDDKTNAVERNLKTTQTLQDHVNQFAGVCRVEAERNGRILQDYEDLNKKFESMEAEHIAQTDMIKAMEKELLDVKDLLKGERLLTEQLEQLCESSKRHAALQEKKIVFLSEKLEEALSEMADLQEATEGSRFILCGERRMREQEKMIQKELEVHYIDLSSEYNYFKLELEKHSIQSQNNRPLGTEHYESFEKKKNSDISSLLTTMNESSEHVVPVFFDAEEEKSETTKQDDDRFPVCEDPIQNELFKWANTEVLQAEEASTSTPSSSSVSLAAVDHTVKMVGAGADVDDDIVISNMTDVTSLASGSYQTTEMSVDSAQHTEFFLPNLSETTTYDFGSPINDGLDVSICDIKNIFRQWQVEFLVSLGIQTTLDFIKVYEKDQLNLAKRMRRWRKQQKLPAVNTRSCKVALLIWARTCKAVDRFFTKQLEAGNKTPKRPDFLEVGPSASMSSLGFGSSIIDPQNQAEM